ncbi:MAG: hypothetical protein ACI8XO_000002 [Verrucomicrobiales bacterium]|jgi:hypothetical protein
MPELNHFRTFEISQDGGGNALELSRSDERVICLAFDGRFGCFCEIAALTQGAGDGSTSMEEFLEQAGIVAGLHHRGLAGLLDYGDDQGVRFYAVEFIDGEMLSQYASRVNGLPAGLAFGLCADLADALCAISVLDLPIAAGNARVTLDDRGRLRVRIVDYPLGLLNPDGPRETAASVFELAYLLEQLASGEVIGEKGKGAADVGGVVEQLRQLSSIHEAAPILRAAAGGGQFIAVESRHRPKLLLAEKLFSSGSPEGFLSDDYRVENVSSLAADPYSIAVTRVSESRPLRMHVLPPAYILSDGNLPIYEAERSASVVGAEALWRSEHFRLVSEPRVPGFSLTTLLRQAGELSDLEVMLLLDSIETAILEARSAGSDLAKVHPDNVLIHFDGWDYDEAEALMRRRPITAWPEFSVVLRAHQTMRGLTTMTPNAKQRFVQVRAQLEHGEAVPNLGVLELYLQLHDSGRAEQAEELLDRFEQSCKAGVAAAAAAAFIEDEDAFEEEVVSPIAMQISDGATLPEESDDDPELSPLGGGVLFGREQFEDDYEEPQDAGGATGEVSVMSPIAQAMGVAGDESEEECVGGFGEMLGAKAEGDDGATEVGLGSGWLGVGIAGADSMDEEEAVSPFGRSPVDGVGEDEALPELEPGSDSAGGTRGVLFFLALAVGAIALAAVIAHLSGKAFWVK